MSSCRKWRERMPEALYQEMDASARPAFEAHVRSCADCAAELAGLEQMLGLFETRRQSQPPARFWGNVWPDFLRRLDAADAPLARREPWFRSRWFLQVAAAVALVVIGILIGRNLRLSLTPETVESPRHTPAAVEDPLSGRVDRYLERSKLVLWSVDNLDSHGRDLGALDLSPERKLSKELLRETRALKKDLPASRQERLLDLLSDLEIILLQIGNLQDAQASLGVDLARTGIQERALLFKINLEEMRRASERLSKKQGEKRRRAAGVG